MKKLFIFLLIFQILTFPVLSHPGRTDSNGGHWNRKTGEYHYHSGEHAGKSQSSSSEKEQSYSYIPPKKEIRIRIIKPSDTYYAGRSYTFSAIIPKEYSQEDVVWKVEDDEHAEFAGSVLTVKESGYIQISATLEDATAYTSFTVNDFYLVEILEQVIVWSILLGFVFFILVHIFSDSAVMGCLTGVFLVVIPLLSIIISGLTHLFYKFF